MADLTVSTDVDTMLQAADNAGIKTAIGLGNVDNTSDANKPVSTAAQTALNLKANLLSPTFTGTPAAPTASLGTNTTQLASTAFVQTAVGAIRKVFGVTIDGGGSAPTTGVKGYWRAPAAGVIKKFSLLADQSGSAVIDVWKDTYANYPPTISDTITASAKPTLSSATKAENSTLTGWTTSFAAGDVFGFNLDSVTTCTRLTLTIEYEAS